MKRINKVFQGTLFLMGLLLVFWCDKTQVISATNDSIGTIHFDGSYYPFPPGQTDHLITNLYSTRTARHNRKEDAGAPLSDSINVTLQMKDMAMTTAEYAYYQKKDLMITVYNSNQGWQASTKFIFGDLFKNKRNLQNDDRTTDVFAYLNLKKSDGVPVEPKVVSDNSTADSTTKCEIRLEIKDEKQADSVVIYDTNTDENIVNSNNLTIMNISNPKRQAASTTAVQKLSQEDLSQASIQKLKVNFDETVSGFDEGFNVLDTSNDDIYDTQNQVQYVFNQQAVFVLTPPEIYQSGRGYPLKVVVVSDEANRDDILTVDLKADRTLIDSGLNARYDPETKLQKVALEKTFTGDLNNHLYKQTIFEFPEVMVERITGKLYLKDEMNNGLPTQFPLIEGGRKFYSRLWVPTIGQSYPFYLEVNDKYGNQQSTKIAYESEKRLSIPMDAYLFVTPESKTLDGDGILFEPTNQSGTRKWSKHEREWVKKG